METDPPGADQARQGSFLVLLRRDFPSGTETKYNYVTVNTFDQCGQLETPYADLGTMVQKTHPGTNMDEFFAHTTKARELVRTEVWELIDQAE